MFCPFFSPPCTLTHSHTHPFSFTDRDYKAVSGHSKHVASLNGITTVEKEKFPKNFWPDVSIRVRAHMRLFVRVFVWRGAGDSLRELLGLMGLLGPLWLSACSDRKMR